MKTNLKVNVTNIQIEILTLSCVWVFGIGVGGWIGNSFSENYISLKGVGFRFTCKSIFYRDSSAQG